MLGIGSHHGNDRIAWDLIDGLNQHYGNYEHIQLVKCQRTPFDFWGELQPCHELIVLDAVVQGQHPGKIHQIKFEHSHHYFSQTVASSSHNICILTALELAQQLSVLPKLAEIWAVEVEAVEELHSDNLPLGQKRFETILHDLQILLGYRIKKNSFY